MTLILLGTGPTIGRSGAGVNAHLSGSGTRESLLKNLGLSLVDNGMRLVSNTHFKIFYSLIDFVHSIYPSTLDHFQHFQFSAHSSPSVRLYDSGQRGYIFVVDALDLRHLAVAICPAL